MAKEANQLEENKAVKPSSAPPDNAIKNEKTLKWIETTVAILLGITTLLSAAATWIGSLHHGIQSINFTKSNNMAAQGNSEYNMGMQLYLSDYMTWNVLKEYYYELDAAKENGNQEKVDQLNERIKSFQVESASAILSEGIQWMEKNNEDNPFKMPGMTEKYFESAQAKVDESQELLEEVPFDKITVSMLVKRCGIHHNTFYYHYQDIYQLLDEWMTQKLAQFSHERSTDSWEKNLKAFLQNCKKNQKIVKHIMNSLSRDQLERFVFSSTNDVFDSYVRKEAQGRSVPEKEIEDIAAFCRYAIFGFFLKFCWNNMEEDIDEGIDRMSKVLHGFICQALHSSQGDPKGK